MEWYATPYFVKFFSLIFLNFFSISKMSVIGVILLIGAAVFLFNLGKKFAPKANSVQPGTGIRTAPPNRSDLIFDPANRRINVPTRLVTGLRGTESVDPRFAPYELVGIAHSTDPSEDTVFNLYGRPHARDRNRYQYRIIDKETGITINLNEGDPMPELFDNDQVQIVGKESIGDFTVLLNPKDPYLPTYL